MEGTRNTIFDNSIPISVFSQMMKESKSNYEMIVKEQMYLSRKKVLIEKIIKVPTI